jgi:MFS transporter, PAT family, beta-lactamase induction signal transducer AmpG
VTKAVPLRTRLAWIAAVAFASGFPFGLINETLPVYLRTEGASLVDVGLVSAVSFPWTFKFLWAPLVDRVGARRQWITACLGALALLTLLVGHADPRALAGSFWLLLVVMVTLSATQDVAIDAFTIETASDRELGVANSVRITLYRIAMFVAGGALVWLAGRSGWDTAFTVGAAVLGALAVLALAMPTSRRDVSRTEPIWAPIRALAARPGIWAVVVFALLFKLDIALLEPMMRAFWVDRGLTLEEIGLYLGTGRIFATIGGAVLGGIVTTRWGIGRALWTLGLVQAFSALGYWAAAAFTSSHEAVIAAALFESFAAGMGTAAFVAYLMSVAERRFAATQYALLSALLALTRSVAGRVSGEIAERTGYATFFLIAFLVGLPAFALIPLLRRAERPAEPDAELTAPA